MHHLMQIRPSDRNVEQFLLQAANEPLKAFNDLDLSEKSIQRNGYGAVLERIGAACQTTTWRKRRPNSMKTMVKSRKSGSQVSSRPKKFIAAAS